MKDLKKDPAALGILGTSIDGRILHMDMVTVLAVARTYGDEQLHDLMRAEGMSLTATSAITPAERLETSELGRMLRDNSLGTRKVGQKPGGGTKTAFASLAKIARTNDGTINPGYRRRAATNWPRRLVRGRAGPGDRVEVLQRPLHIAWRRAHSCRDHVADADKPSGDRELRARQAAELWSSDRLPEYRVIRRRVAAHRRAATRPCERAPLDETGAERGSTSRRLRQKVQRRRQQPRARKLLLPDTCSHAFVLPVRTRGTTIAGLDNEGAAGLANRQTRASRPRRPAELWRDAPPDLPCRGCENLEVLAGGLTRGRLASARRCRFPGAAATAADAACRCGGRVSPHR